MTNSINSTMANKPAFGGCAVLGNGAKEYFAKRLAKEGEHAIAEFKKFCDELTNWGYININKTPKKDVFELQGINSHYTTKITANDRLDWLKSKMRFMEENNAIIDQA